MINWEDAVLGHTSPSSCVHRDVTDHHSTGNQSNNKIYLWRLLMYPMYAVETPLSRWPLLLRSFNLLIHSLMGNFVCACVLFYVAFRAKQSSTVSNNTRHVIVNSKESNPGSFEHNLLLKESIFVWVYYLNILLCNKKMFGKPTRKFDYSES